MYVTSVVIIGAGHAGLAMSRRLTEASIDHVVLERGEIANSWRYERWDSLRLLTPNWHSRLPGMSGHSEHPDGFMTAREVVAYIDSYAATIDAPVRTGTTVTCVTAEQPGYRVRTDCGTWRCDAVVVASGAANKANVPGLASAVPDSVDMVTAISYRSPERLAKRGVLVVGASATGIQLADEIHRSGRSVTIAIGEQVRLPRSYRGRDIFWWLDASGVLDERHDEVDDLVRARHVPSPQLIGTSERRSLDLNVLGGLGVRVVGRLCSVRDGVAQFSGGLANNCRLADLKLNRLLDRFDEWARSRGDLTSPPHRFEPTRVPATPTLEIDLRREDIGTVVWATGYRPDYRWLQVPVVDPTGRIRHDGGVVRDASGMYLLGANLLRTRRSSYLGGADADTRELAAELRSHINQLSRTRPACALERCRGATGGVGAVAARPNPSRQGKGAVPMTSVRPKRKRHLTAVSGSRIRLEETVGTAEGTGARCATSYEAEALVTRSGGVSRAQAGTVEIALEE